MGFVYRVGMNAKIRAHLEAGIANYQPGTISLEETTKAFFVRGDRTTDLLKIAKGAGGLGAKSVRAGTSADGRAFVRVEK